MSEGARVALVTGASRGIGKAIAIELGRQGLTVVGTATSDAGATAISAYLAENAVRGQGLVLDVASDEGVALCLETVTENFDAPQIVVNNAGITRDNLLMRMKASEWEAVINTNLTAMYRVCKGSLKGMTRARWGRIINISSVVGSSGNAGQTNYAASKSGVEGFSRALAKEVGSRGITVNVVAPGFIDTDMTSELPAKQRETLLAQIPLARLGNPEEIAAVVGFLASEKAGYITGETVHVNGGMYMG
ncbi:MAG: 3-oxoacyl-ACP reductase FabG [Gammaproteobacteria bacterium]|jgi:3-oxoacyl-[acyl-carrier protein] reductase